MVAVDTPVYEAMRILDDGQGNVKVNLYGNHNDLIAIAGENLVTLFGSDYSKKPRRKFLKDLWIRFSSDI